MAVSATEERVQLDIRIKDDVASTVIQLKGPASCSRMSDLGPMFDKLGVDIVSCSTIPSAGSADMTLVVVDRHDSQPLDSVLKQSVREGLHVLLGRHSDSITDGGPVLETCPTLSTNAGVAAVGTSGRKPAAAIAAAAAAAASSASGDHSEDSGSCPPLDICRADSASEGIQHTSRALSRQHSWSETQPQGWQQQYNQQILQLLQLSQAQTPAAQGHSTSSSSSSRGMSASNWQASSSGKVRTKAMCPADEQSCGNLLPHTVECCFTDGAGGATAPRQTTAASGSMVRCKSSKNSRGSKSVPTSNEQLPGIFTSGLAVTAAWMTQHQQGLQKWDVSQRLIQLGMPRATAAGPTGGGSSSSNDSEGEGDNAQHGHKQAWSLQEWPAGTSPSPLAKQSQGVPRQQFGRGLLRHSSCDMQGHTAAAAAVPEGPERSAKSDSGAKIAVLCRQAEASLTQQPSQQPQQRKARRRGPARTPSRIILSPIGPDGSADSQGTPTIFYAIPKQQAGADKRSSSSTTMGSGSGRRPVRRSVTCAQLTPGSAASRQVLEQLLGAQRFQHLAIPGEDSKAVAAAAAAAGMPYNVAVAAAQLLGSKGNAREAAAAAAAAVAVNEQQQLQVEQEAGGSAASPLRLSLDAAELMSPAATPRRPPLTPATPVHPAVAAAAAAAIAAAAEAAEEVAVAAAAAQADTTVAHSPIPGLLPRLPSFQLMRKASGVFTVPEEGEDCSSACESSFAPDGAGGSSPHSVGSHVSSSSSSGSFEEWGFRSLTGVVVGELMTSPVYHVHQDREVSVAMQLMTQRNLPGLLVDTGPGSQPGFLTHRDFFKASMRRRSFRKRQLPAIRVKDIMSHPVVAVDIDMAIEACAEVMQERGIKRAVVRDPAAVDPEQPLAQYVGLVSDTSIFKCLGLYPEDGLAVDELEPVLHQHVLHAESSAEGSGQVTPATNSRAATPVGLVPVAGDQPLPPAGLPHEQAAGAAAPVNGRRVAAGDQLGTNIITLPDLVAMREGGGRQGSSFSSAGSLTSCGSSSCTVADVQMHGPASSKAASSAAAARDAGVAVAAGLSLHHEGSDGAVLSEPDAFLRYKTAASLWEVDMADMEMIRRIGEGSFGEVMLATFRGTKVAVKRLRALDMDDLPMSGGFSRSRGSQAAFQQFFEREIAILASIRHPNVVNFIGACHRPGQRCLVTEYCARGSLDQVLHKSGLALDLAKRVEFAMDISRGMVCLHAQRPIIIHRDLKTANLLVSARFEVKVADFGLSRIKDASHLQVSRAGLEGTIEYCAPEVLRGEPYTERCDVYSFGVVLWELLLRERPYSDTDVPIFLLMVNIGNGSLRLPEVPEDMATPGLVELVERCLAFLPADRPDFLEVLQLLEQEYKGIRGGQQRQQARQQAGQSVAATATAAPAPAAPAPAAEAAAVPRCDSASSMSPAVLMRPSAGTAADNAELGMSSGRQSPACGSGGGAGEAVGLVLLNVGSTSSSVDLAPDAAPAAAAGLPGGAAAQSALVDGWQLQHSAGNMTGLVCQPLYYQQQQQSASLQWRPPGAACPGGSSQHLSPAAGSVQPALMYAVNPYDHSQQLFSVPLPSAISVPQQQYVYPGDSTCSSPRAQQQQQQQHPAWPVQQNPAGPAAGMRVLSAFAAAPSAVGGMQPQFQAATPLPGLPGGPGGLSTPGAAMAAVNTSRSRKSKGLSRVRSLPTPQVIDWDSDEADEQELAAPAASGMAGGQCGVAGDGLCAEDSFATTDFSMSSGGLRSLSGYSQSGQLCVVLDPAAAAAAAATGRAASAGGLAAPMYQPLMVQTQQGPVPLIIAQPGGMQQPGYAAVPPHQQQLHPAQQQQQYMQQQQQYMQPQQYLQPQQQQQQHVQQRVLSARQAASPSPTPTAFMSPLSSSPAGQGLHSLALRAAAGAAAAARRDGSTSGAGSGSASPTAVAAGLECSGGLPGLAEDQLLHRRLGSLGGSGSRELPAVHQLMQLTDVGSPLTRSSEPGTGYASPVLLAGQVPGPVAAPLLLQRLDSLHRSGSAGSLNGGVPGLVGGALQHDSPGQVVGLIVAGSPRTYSPPLYASPTPGLPPVASATGHGHRLVSSRLAVQGSYELPAGVGAVATGAGHLLSGTASESGVSSMLPHAAPAHPHLCGPGPMRKGSLLRIESSSRDRDTSPFAVVANDTAAPSTIAGRQAVSSNGGLLLPLVAASPFAAVAAMSGADAGYRSCAAAAAAIGGTTADGGAKGSVACAPGAPPAARQQLGVSKCSGQVHGRFASPFAAVSDTADPCGLDDSNAADISPRRDLYQGSSRAASPVSSSGKDVEHGSRKPQPVAAVCRKPAPSPFALLQEPVVPDDT